MKFIKVDFYDNDFSSQFLYAGEKIKEYMYRRDIEYDDFLLDNLKQIIIDLVRSLSKLFHLASYDRERSFLRECYSNNKELEDKKIYEAKERYIKYDISEYLSEIDLSIIEANIEDLEWNNGESLYIPIGNYVGDVRPFIL